MSWKPVMVMKDGERCSNALRFATEAEARASAHELFMRWTQPSDYDAEQSDDPVTYRFDSALGNVRLESEADHASK